MLIRPASSEITMIFRGLIVLMLVVLLGVSLAESQLNTLTQRQECVEVLNIHRGKTGIYSFYLLGMDYNVRGVYDIARIRNSDKEIVIEASGYKLAIPTYAEFNYSQLQSICSLWHTQFVAEAFKFKNSFIQYTQEIKDITNYYIEQYR